MFSHWKYFVRNGSTRASPLCSWNDCNTLHITMCGHRSGLPFKPVLLAMGPNQPSACWLASTASIHFRALRVIARSPST
ncbi:MAG TPA: hypothetical protein PKI20_08380 [Verrucomicrobiota bacterium]|nr:hypothetical protein [Verrucomicrobiota bacterium]HQL77725.1 hypothetical protein [Verrucomicrobiota bacterium]